MGILKVANWQDSRAARYPRGAEIPLFFGLCRVEYSRAHELRLPIRRVDWSRGADSPCFTLSLTSSHSALKYLTQSSGNLQETDLQTC